MSFASMNPQSIQDHVARFQLIHDHSLWHKEYYEYREPYPIPDSVYDKEDKMYSMVYATFQTLAYSGQLRVNRFSNGNQKNGYHTIDILDRDQHTIVTLIGSVNDLEIGCTDAYMRTIMHTKPVMDSHTLIKIALVLPIRLPHFPEFCDEEGQPLDLQYNNDSEIFPVHIQIDRTFVTDDFIV